MRNWSAFTPNLSSWINALLLATLLIIATSLVPVLHYIWTIIVFISAWMFYFVSIFLYFLASILPQFIQQIIISLISFITSIIGNLITLISPLILLLPIPIVAFAHHYLYLLLDRFYPELTAGERGRVTGYIPGIVSWWHGLFALVVVVMAMLCSDSLLSILPWLSHNAADCLASQTSELNASATTRVGLWVQIALMIFRQPIYSPFLRLVIWVVSAAYLYQFEFIFRQHLITANDPRTNGDR
ncbi:MAG: hypothetical protein AAFQ14_16585 [Cyanobacteria bacterium J06621_12]